jgi:hypothetical protein
MFWGLFLITTIQANYMVAPDTIVYHPLHMYEDRLACETARIIFEERYKLPLESELQCIRTDET